LFLKITARSDWPTSDGRWDLVSLEMRSRAPIFNGSSLTENGHLWKNAHFVPIR
jgi:hypothetical protein